MKRIGQILTFLLILIGSWTASSQTTGIQGLNRDQKIEVVSTLLEYPIVVRELSATKELLAITELQHRELRAIITNQNNQINNLVKKNDITERQLSIALQQTAAETTSGKDKLLWGGVGVTVGLVLAALISIF